MRQGLTTIQRVSGCALLLCTTPVSHTVPGTQEALRLSSVAGSQPDWSSASRPLDA